jgi:hypothetical protein
MSFYNTTGESGHQLDMFTMKAHSQDEAILRFFKKFPNMEISAGDIQLNQVCDSNTPLTSIRRSVNTLLKRLEIIAYGKKESLYGRPETTYKLNPDIITK